MLLLEHHIAGHQVMLVSPGRIMSLMLVLAPGDLLLTRVAMIRSM